MVLAYSLPFIMDNNQRPLRIIKQIDDISIKEVPVQELIKIYKTRIKEDIGEKELEKHLQHLEMWYIQ